MPDLGPTAGAMLAFVLGGIFTTIVTLVGAEIRASRDHVRRMEQIRAGRPTTWSSLRSVRLRATRSSACRSDDPPIEGIGAEDGTRTRDPHLGKVMLYQLSHFRPEHAHP
jgi:hypothetical protein